MDLKTNSNGQILGNCKYVFSILKIKFEVIHLYMKTDSQSLRLIRKLQLKNNKKLESFLIILVLSRFNLIPNSKFHIS